MSQTFWTLTYLGSEKSFGDWGLSKPSRRRRNMSITEMTIVADGQPIDSADLFSFQSQVIIKRDRVLTNGVYSGGSQYMVGVVTDSHREGNESSENVVYTFSNVWWYLQSIYYEQNWPFVGVTDHVVLNRVPQYSLLQRSIRDQVADILDWVLAQVPNAFSYDVSALPGIFPPCDEKRSLTCDEAIKNQMQWIQDGVVRVDETQNPPKFYFTSRYGDTAFSGSPVLQMQRVTLNIGTGTNGEHIQISSESIRPLYKLRCPQVVMRYEQTNKIGNAESLVLVTDKYPAASDSGSVLNILRQTVNLLGAQGSDQEATVESENLSVFDTPDWVAWFIQNHPFLNNVSNLTLIDSQVFITDESNNPLNFEGVLSATPFELLNHGCFHNWMRVGNAANGAIAIKQRVKITGYFSYVDEFGQIVDGIEGREVTVSVDMVNLAPGTYNRVVLSQVADSIPGLIDPIANTWNIDITKSAQYGLSLAYWFYKILSVLQWEGDVVIDDNQSDGEVARADYLGVALNLANGLTAWSTMDAIVQTVTEDLESGKVTVSFGQNKLLSAGKLLDLARNNRTRVYSSYQQTMAQGGSTQNSQIESPDTTARKDSTRGNALFNKQITAWTDSDGNQTRLTTDAVNGVITIESDDVTKGSIVLNLKDLTP